MEQTRARARTLPWDWHPGTIPDNVVLDESAYVETSFSFLAFRSAAPVGARFGRGAAAYKSTMFDVGPRGVVSVGDFALVHGARVICDRLIEIGDHVLISWNVVIMDTYRASLDPLERRRAILSATRGESEARPVRIGSNVWLGFDVCVLPGVSIGEGAIVGARSAVFDDVPAYTVVAGNPARVIRRLDPPASPTAANRRSGP
jgi:acetyltransferase-like isoleucine patch superfamily enzyme